MKSNLHLFLGLLILIAFGGGFLKALQHHPATSFQVNFHPALIAQKPRFESDFASSKLHTSTHAASLVELKDGRVRAFWFSGSYEGARDVQIHSAVFDPKIDKWNAEQVVATRLDTEKSVLRYV
ncbi:MAG: exo-alpha-sialidase, partial [Abditibacteriaceae bacterium]